MMDRQILNEKKLMPVSIKYKNKVNILAMRLVVCFTEGWNLLIMTG